MSHPRTRSGLARLLTALLATTVLTTAAPALAAVQPAPPELLEVAAAEDTTALRGRVLLPDGTPAAGAEVEVAAEGFPTTVVTTAVDGTWSHKPFSPTHYRLQARPAGGGPAVAAAADRFVRLAGDVLPPIGDLLLRTPTHTGTVRLPDGSPAAGALVRAVGAAGTPAGSVARSVDHDQTAVADAAGGYALALTEGSWSVSAAPAETAPDSLASGMLARFAVPAGSRPVTTLPDLPLPTATVSGQVDQLLSRSTTPTPVPSPVVALLPDAGGDPLAARGLGDGRWVAAAPVDTFLRLRVATRLVPSADRSRVAQHEYEDGRADSFVLRRDGTVEGDTSARLVDAAAGGTVLGPDGLPVPDAVVTLEPGTPGAAEWSAAANAFGHWSLPGAALQAGVSALRAQVGPRDPRALAPSRLPVGEPPGGTVELGLTDATISGRVLDPDGTVRTRPARVFLDGSDEQAMPTRADGSYALRGTPRQDHTVVAEVPNGDLLPGRRSVFSSDVKTGVDLALRGPTVHGRMTVPDGAEQGPWQLHGYDLDRHLPLLSEYHRTAEDGTFDLLLEAGRYRLWAIPPPGVETGDAVADVVVPATGEVDVVMVPRDRDDWPLELHLASRRVDGTSSSTTGEQVALSADGRRIAFSSDGQLDPDAGDTWGDWMHVASTDPDAPSLRRLGQLHEEGDPLVTMSQPALDHDGSTLALVSDVPLTADEHEDGREHVYTIDTATGATTWVSRPAEGGWNQGRARQPALDGSGDLVAFVATTGLDEDQVPDGAADSADVVWLRAGDELQLLSGPQAYDVAAPSLSGDGRTATWWERAADGTWSLHLLDRRLGDRIVLPGAFTGDDPESASLTTDGGQVAYTIAEWDGDGTRSLPRLWTRTPGEGLAGTAQAPPLFRDYATTNARGLTLSPDGSQYTFLATPPWGGSRQAWVRVLDPAQEALLVSRLVDGSAGRHPSFRTTVAAGVLAIPSDGGLVDAPPPNNPDYHATNVYVARARAAGLPSWPAGSALTAVPASTSVDVTWPAATGGAGVTGYRVLRDGELVAERPASARTARVDGLQPASTYVLAVEAVDAAGAASEPDLSTEVTTLPDVAGEARLDATPVGSRAVQLRWDASGVPGLTGYRVLRAVGDGPLVPLVDLPLDRLAHDDEGLAAATQHRYVVEALVAATSSAHTRESSATTGDLVAPQGRFTAGTVRGGAVDRTKPVMLRVLGETGRTAVARVTTTSWYADGSPVPLPAPRDVTTDVPLVEDPRDPGLYRASLALADGTGSIEQVVGVLRDGHGGEAAGATAPGLPLGTSALLRVVTTAPAEELAALSAVVTSATTGLGRVVAAAPLLELPVTSAADLDVRLQLEDGRVAGGARAVGLRPGLTEEIALTPGRPASALLSVVTARGEAVPGAKVRMAFEGLPVGEAIPTEQGFEVRDSDGMSGRPLTLRVEPPADRPLDGAEVPLVLQRIGQPVTVTLPDLPTSTISGTVREGDGAPADGARVAMTQTVDDRRWAVTAVTDEAGRYEVTALRGPAELSATWRRLVTTGQVDASAGDVVAELTLPRQRIYDIDLQLTVQQPGGVVEGPFPLDWRTSVHYRLRLESTTRTVTGINGDGPGGRIVPVEGAPGSTIRACADGVEAGLGWRQICSEVVLPASNAQPVPLDLALRPAGGLRARLLDGAGQPAGRWYASLTPLDGATPTTTHSGTASAPTGRHLEIVAGAAGRHRLHLRTDHGMREIEVDVPDGRMLDLGELRVTPGARFSGEGNGVTVSRGEATVGEVVQARVALRPSTAAPGAVLVVATPPGAVVRTDGALVDGKPATVSDRGEIPLGDLTAGSDHVVRYAVEVTSARGRDVLPLTAQVRAGGTSDSLSPASVQVVGVSLEAPATVGSHTVPVSGLAEPGSVVDVREAGAVVASALTTRGGTWRTTVVLPDRGQLSDHHLEAVAKAGGAELGRATATVRVDARGVELVEIAVSQRDAGRPDGRRYAFDPRRGVARFPFVFVPGQLFVVDARFDDPDRVRNVRALVGDRSAPMVRQADGSYAAEMFITGHGGVKVDFDVAPLPMDLGAPLPAEEVLRSGLPPLLADARLTGEPRRAGDTVEGEFSLPGAGRTGSAKVTIKRLAGYVPSAADQRAADANGAPVYALDVDLRGDTLSVSYVVEVPEPSAGGDLRSASTQVVTKAAYEVVAIASVNGLAYADGLRDSVESGGKYDRLGALLDRLGGCDGSPAVNAVRQRLDELADLAILNDASSAMLTLVGFVFAPATLGGTLLLVATTQAISAGLDHQFDGYLAEVGARIDNLRECKDEEDDEPEDPSRLPEDPDAKPVWIFDPSGYAFEGVRSSRLQGVTTTLLFSASENGPWQVWDAEWYGQVNPLTTDANGRYGWDVPEGWWRVQFAKPGYERAYSKALKVLPPHLDVDVSLRRLAAPAVTTATATKGAVEVGFDTWVLASSLEDESVRVLGSDGAPLEGAVTAGPTERAEDGLDVTRSVRFTAAAARVPGEVLRLVLDAPLRSYADQVLLAPVEREVTVATGGGGGPGGGGGGGGGTPSPSPSASPSASPTASPSASPTPRPTGSPSPRPTGTPTPTPTTSPGRPVPVAHDTDQACPTTQVPAKGFGDVPAGSTHAALVDCLAWWGITVGRPDGSFGPQLAVTRAQMATFLARVISAAGGSLPEGPPDAFDDDGGLGHDRAIDQLAAVGIVLGRGERRFGPLDTVSRAAMASFLVRTYAYVVGEPPASRGDTFADDDSSTHEESIDRAASAGLVVGTGGARYGPDGEVRREQMASFLMRLLDAFVDDGHGAPPSGR